MTKVFILRDFNKAIIACKDVQLVTADLETQGIEVINMCFWETKIIMQFPDGKIPHSYLLGWLIKQGYKFQTYFVMPDLFDNPTVEEFYAMLQFGINWEGNIEEIERNWNNPIVLDFIKFLSENPELTFFYPGKIEAENEGEQEG